MASIRPKIKKASRREDGGENGRSHAGRIGALLVHDIVPLVLWFAKATFVGLVGFLATMFLATTLVREIGVFIAQTAGLAPEASTMMWVLGFVGPYFFIILMLAAGLCCCIRGLWKGVGKGLSFVASRLAVWYDGRNGKGSSEMTSEVET